MEATELIQKLTDSGGVTAELPSHQIALRQELLQRQAQQITKYISSEAKSNRKLSGLGSIRQTIGGLFAGRLIKLFMFALLIILFGVATLFNVDISWPGQEPQPQNQQQQNAEVLPEDRVKIKTKEELLVKAGEQALANTSGKYTYKDFTLELKADSGKTRRVRVQSTTEPMELSSRGEQLGMPFSQTVTTDLDSGKILTATKTGVLLVSKDFSRVSRRDPSEVRYYKAGEKYYLFMSCENCTPEEIENINNNYYPTPVNGYPIAKAGNYTPDSGGCGTNDGGRMSIECYGMVFVSTAPLINTGEENSPLRATSRADFIERAQLQGFEQVDPAWKGASGETDPRFSQELKDDNLYWLFSSFQPDPENPAEQSDLIEQLRNDPKASYLGEQVIDGRNLGMISLPSTDPTGSYLSLVGYDLESFNLAYVHKQKVTPTGLISRYIYRVEAMIGIQESAKIQVSF